MTPHVRALPFSPAMARAWVEGRKRQTRRVIVPQPQEIADNGAFVAWFWKPKGRDGHDSVHEAWPSCLLSSCPYGVPGDTLVLTGEWAVCKSADDYPGRDLAYSANHWTIYDSPEKPEWCGRTRSSRFVPRGLYDWFPHTTNELVRAQRVQDISEGDAKAEGAVPDCEPNGVYKALCVAAGHPGPSARDYFSVLWDRINAKRKGGIYSWDKSPWVFALTIGGPK